MATHAYELVIGTPRWSSWSLRPWIAMRRARIAFKETVVALRRPDTAASAGRHSPSSRVPALVIGDEVIWDSLAILETVAERHPGARLWPEDAAARAHGRSLSAEMHSSFQALRQHCPMDFSRRAPMAGLPDPVAADVRRIVGAWGASRRRYGAGGPFLLGAYSVADAMFAPVVSRFETYIPDLAPHGDDGTAGAYVAAVTATPEYKAWGDLADRVDQG